MKRIPKCFVAICYLVSLSSCDGSFHLSDRNNGLVFDNKEHYRLVDGEKKDASNHVFDKLVLAYEEKRSYDDDYYVHYYDYVCRCGYRMSYDKFSFEKTKEGMALTGFKRKLTGYGISNVTYQDRTLSDLYSIPSFYEGEKVTVLGENAFYDENAEKTYECKGKENIFENITTIKAHAFYQSCISFPILNFSNVTTIEDDAFAKCEFGKLIFGEKLTSIGNYAFANSDANGVDLSSCPIEEIPGSCFTGCSSLRKVSLPSALKKIGGSAFYNCTALQSLVLPDGLESIEKYAFVGCTNLESIVVPSSLNWLSEEHFLSYLSKDYIRLTYIFYKGSKEQADSVFASRLSSFVYLYSENEPNETGRYWHYVDGEPTIYK